MGINKSVQAKSPNASIFSLKRKTDRDTTMIISIVLFILSADSTCKADGIAIWPNRLSRYSGRVSKKKRLYAK